MNIIGIIPARMASTRFPGKPLKSICGMPMIGHVYYRSKMANIIDEVYVATCDQEIADYIKTIGGEVIMTSDTHERASDRAEEALIKIENKTNKKVDIIVMLQGDEPMIVPEMIDKAVEPLIKNKSINVSNLMSKIKSEDELNDANEVKVVFDQNNDALYFSREPIPSRKKFFGEIPAYKQVCVIPFKRECLLAYSKLKPSVLEIIESVDMNRFLEYGIKVRMVLTDYETWAVDTKEDLDIVNSKMQNDRLMNEYKFCI